MGYNTEINYILKCSSEPESLKAFSNLKYGNQVVITKSVHITFVLDSPILIADHNWAIRECAKLLNLKFLKIK